MSSPGALGARATDVAPCIHNVLFFHVLHFFLVVLVYFLFRVVSCFTSFVFIFIEGERAHAESGHVGCDAGGLRPTGRYIDC